MQRWKRCAWITFGILQVIVFMAAAVKPAHAYVDPGSGLLFLQVGGSMLAGAMFVLRSKLRKLFRLGPSAAETAEAEKKDAGQAGAGPSA